MPLKEPKKDCPFCRKECTENYFHSSDHFVAIYNISPILPGHSLVIPKKHIESLAQLSDADLCEMMLFARKVTKVLKTVFNSDGFDWTVQDGISAGQTVPHVHLHIIPRKLHDLPESNEWYSMIADNEHQLLDSRNREKLSDRDYTDITAMLSKASNSLLV